jgi:hypothetical protein
MTQIAFLTLFLGLTSGIHPVEVTVAGPVDAVELLLDGQRVATLRQLPWRHQVEFGARLAPHELVARALDAQGRELARAGQWINLPRPPAEVEVLLEADVDGRPLAAHLAWESLTGARPEDVRLALDGQALAVDARGRAALPRLDLQATHVLSAELRFAAEGTARRDVAFGGEWGATVSSLTAVPVRLARPGHEPSLEQLQAWLSAAGRPARVVAVEEGPAQVIVVRALAAREAARRLGGGKRRGAMAAGGAVPTFNSSVDWQSAQQYADDLRHEMRLGRDDRLRFLWPTAKSATAATLPTELFAGSREFTAEDGGLHWLLTQIYHSLETETGQRFADAAAVAGIQAAAGNRRRAVVVVLGGDCADASRHDPAAVRGYLAAIRVPLYVWSTADLRHCPAAAAWGGAEPIYPLPNLRRAANRLREELAAQRIVWIEGQQPPQAVTLAAGAGVTEVASSATP